MPRGSSSKRERQQEQIKEGAEQQGERTQRAKETEAGTVSKERGRSGESRTAQRGGQRARGGSKEPTYDQLYAEAQRRNIHGRSSMNKSELKRSLGR